MTASTCPTTPCRILVFDSKPYSESLIRPVPGILPAGQRSDADADNPDRRAGDGPQRARRKGLLRQSVVIGTDLVRLIRDRESRRYLSSQMAAQIELGLEIADMARQEIEDGNKPVGGFQWACCVSASSRDRGLEGVLCRADG